MSKIKKSELLDIVREQGSAITNLLQRVTFLENPHLKHLDQSVFDGLDEKWRFAAVDSDGSRAVFTSDNITQRYDKHYVNALSGEVKQVLGRVDASNWQNSLIEREPELQLKQLEQSVFDGLDSDYMFAAIDGCNGRTYAYEEKPHVPVGKDYWRVHGGMQHPVDYGYDTSNWQNSLIERDTAELLEVDLSTELTGSDLTKSILSKKFMQACLVSDSSDNDALQGDDLQLIRMYNETNGKFISMRDPWYGCQHKYAVAVDNNRKPLTASEVGL